MKKIERIYKDYIGKVSYKPSDIIIPKTVISPIDYLLVDKSSVSEDELIENCLPQSLHKYS